MSNRELDALKSEHEGKKRHESLEDAAATAREQSERERIDFGAYKCGYCDGYHVGRTRISKAARRRY